MRVFLLYFFFCIPLIGTAQEDAWVYFNNKPNAQFYLNNPLEILSQRALDRRAAQGIALDVKDAPIHPQYIGMIGSMDGITIMAKSKWLNALHIRGSVGEINGLLELPFVESVEFANKSLNATGRMAGEKQYKAVNKTFDTAADFNYGTSSGQIEMLNGHLLHQAGYTGGGKIIAVLDAGFPGVNSEQPFQRLLNNNLILGGYNFVTRSENFYTGNTHGTLVLSTMGGYTQNQLVGTAPDASYYLFVTEDSSGENPVEESLWVEAAEMADSLGVDVINTSLGYFLYDDPSYSYSFEDIDGQTAFITRGANVAFTRGMLCVTSAGNSGQTMNPNIGVLADAFNTLTVGAVDATEALALFSSRGPTFDERIKPDVVAQGAASVISSASGMIGTANGTSFSSPITAGLVACLWQALPEKTNAEILQIIKESADRYNNPNFEYGYGVPDFYQALQIALDTVENTDDNRFIIYPNPFSGENLKVVFPADADSVNVTIFNSLGQLIMERTIFKETPTFSAQMLAEGIYSYRLESPKQSQTGRLIRE